MDLSNENVIHVKKDGMEYLQFRKLLEYKDKINHAYSLGINLNFRTAKPNKQRLTDEQYSKAINCYKKLCSNLNTNYINVVKTNQEHTDEIKVVKQKINKSEPDFNLNEYEKTDGLMTNNKNLILSTTNADCILLLFYDPNKNVIANVHSGWRGTLQRIAQKTVKKMIFEFGCNPQDIICCICPSIRKCHFEVEQEVKGLFEEEFKELKLINQWIEEKEQNKKWNIDTVFINKEMLRQQGLRQENIIDSGICSVCESELIHSFRVEKQDYGLNTALIELIK